MGPWQHIEQGRQTSKSRINVEVRSFTLPSFWKAYRRLPEHVQRQARQSYIFFASDPRHRSLDFKRVSQ